ncbi:hypothetical protein [Cupriavidus basilensis]|uniref:Putative dioxygenase n=1 Tax=Cupriavidus basilensis TaxID=68895 RepID=A0A0C4Y7M0_9BURK|nr:hypothetical protein [Cupriavidus basilensis]AJG21427.1 Putative dioxygenase [Cupriavidus basilensis]
MRIATGADGAAQFLTIYPGWYAPRAVRIHLKIHLGKTEVLTSLLFFDDALSREVHLQHAAYRTRGASPVQNAQDGIAGARLTATGSGGFPKKTPPDPSAEALNREEFGRAARPRHSEGTERRDAWSIRRARHR